MRGGLLSAYPDPGLPEADRAPRTVPSAWGHLPEVVTGARGGRRLTGDAAVSRNPAEEEDGGPERSGSDVRERQVVPLSVPLVPNCLLGVLL